LSFGGPPRIAVWTGIAPGLRAVAHAEDCLIEALELQSSSWCLAVQWHPEPGDSSSGSQSSPGHMRFASLVEAARDRANRLAEAGHR
jgi:gamma-glutamyl-gamma-aminobutyrate hydrolase PuuD